MHHCFSCDNDINSYMTQYIRVLIEKKISNDAYSVAANLSLYM